MKTLIFYGGLRFDEGQALGPLPKLETWRKLTESSIVGNWCGDTIGLKLTRSEMKFKLSDGNTVAFRIQRYRVLEDSIWIYWKLKGHIAVTEFGNFGDNLRTMVQVRGRYDADEKWNDYNRRFKRC